MPGAGDSKIGPTISAPSLFLYNHTIPEAVGCIIILGYAADFRVPQFIPSIAIMINSIFI